MAEFSRDEIRQELMKRGVVPNDVAASMGGGVDPEKQAQMDAFKDATGMNRTPFDTMRDVAGGLMGGIQHGLANMGEAGQAIGNTMAAPFRKYIPDWMKVVPDVNVREELGLGQNNPVDLEKMISSKNPSGLAQGIGKFLPAMAAGGASIPGQMLAAGVYGGATANPDEQNLIAPNGRIGAGVQDALTAGLFGKVGQEVLGGLPITKAVGKYVNNKLDYFRPDKSAEEFLQKLGSGTKEENVQALAKDIDAAYQSKLNDALAHKKPVIEQEGKNNIYETPAGKLPEGNLEKVAYYIAPGEKTTPEQLNNLATEIKNFRRGKVGKDPYDFDDFTHNVSEIFNADMNPTQVANLEHALNIPTKVDSEFLKLADKHSDLLSDDTLDALNKFKKNHSFNNADDLQSALGDEMGTYSQRAEKIGLTKAESAEQKKFKAMRDALKSEMQSHLERVNPDLAKEYTTFSNKYRENVIPYQEENATKAVANEPRYIKERRLENPNLPYNVTGSQMQQAFAEPGRQAMQIANDIGESGRNKVLYNLLGNDLKPDAKGLAESILNAKQAKGYSQYITPEMENFAKELLKRQKLRTKINYGAGGLAGIAGVGAAEEAVRRYLY